MGYLSDISRQLSKEQNVIFVGTGILLINNENRVLLACRTDNGQWSLPGGSLEIGETLEECIVRETREETGIIIKECDIHLNSAKSILEPIIKNGREIFVVSVTYWTNKYDDIDMQIDSREFTKYSWLSYKEIQTINELITPYSRVAIEEYFKKTDR